MRRARFWSIAALLPSQWYARSPSAVLCLQHACLLVAALSRVRASSEAVRSSELLHVYRSVTDVYKSGAVRLAAAHVVSAVPPHSGTLLSRSGAHTTAQSCTLPQNIHHITNDAIAQPQLQEPTTRKASKVVCMWMWLSIARSVLARAACQGSSTNAKRRVLCILRAPVCVLRYEVPVILVFN
jgi:hypothetical protein